MLLLLDFLGAYFLTELVGDVAELFFELELGETDVFEFVFLDAALAVVGAGLVLVFLGLSLESVEVLEVLIVHGGYCRRM